MKNKQKKEAKVHIDLVLDLESSEYINFDEVNERVQEKLKTLHPYEIEIYNLIQDECSIVELSKRTNISYHSLYNTFRKVKQKLKEKI